MAHICGAQPRRCPRGRAIADARSAHLRVPAAVPVRARQDTKQLELRGLMMASYQLRQRMLHFVQSIVYYMMVEVTHLVAFSPPSGPSPASRGACPCRRTAVTAPRWHQFPYGG